MFPLEFVKSNLAAMNGNDKYLVNNHQGMLTSPSTLTNIRRENRLASLQAKGIDPKDADIANVISVVEKIRESDLDMRSNISDNSDCLLGIARKVKIIPELSIELHTRHLLNFVGELSLDGSLVIGIDGTGGLLNFKNSKADGKVQHIIMTVQLSQCLLDRATAQQWGDRLFTPVLFAERISDKNNASSIARWLTNVVRDATDAMESYPQGARGHIMRPVVVQMDCALELMNGCIIGFRSDTQVDCAARYNACVVIIVLHYEYLCSSLSNDNDEAEEERKRYAEQAMYTLLLVSPSVYKQCKYHIAKAISGYPKSRPRHKLPIPMRESYEQFERLFGFLSAEATQVKSMSNLIARICVVVTILRTEYLPCDKFSIRSHTRQGHTLRQTRDIAENMDRVIKDCARSIHIIDEEDRDDRLRGVFADERDDINFSGMDYCQEIIRQMMGTEDHHTEPMPFCCVYLNKVNKWKRTGTVKVVFVISPYRVGDDGIEKVYPYHLGGFEATISLPNNDQRIRNPMFCEEAADYICNQWLNRIGLWSESVLEMVNTAVDRDIFSHNNSVEGTFRAEKHDISEMDEAITSLPAYINMRWKQSVGAGRLVSNEIQRAIDRITNKRRRRINANDASTGNNVKDTSVATGRQVESEMMWKSTAGQVRQELIEKSNKVIQTIQKGNDIGKWKVDTNNKKAMWRIVYDFAAENATSFMKYGNFLNWMKLELKKPLKREWRDVIDSFIKQFDQQSNDK